MDLKRDMQPGLSGNRDVLVVETWLYQLQKYLALMQMRVQNPLSDENRVESALSFLHGTAATWWLSIKQSAQVLLVLGNWDTFVNAIKTESIPQDSTLVARDRAHFMLCKDSYTAVDTAKAFVNSIFILHRLPDDIVSEMDPELTSKFGKAFMELCGVNMEIRSTTHAKRDHSSKIWKKNSPTSQDVIAHTIKEIGLTYSLLQSFSTTRQFSMILEYHHSK